MNIKAFGSVFGQTSNLPIASGFQWQPSDGQKTFSTCRAVFLEADSSSGKDDVYVEFSDGPGQYIHLENIVADQNLPFALTGISGGSLEGAVVLY